ncbi:hypothetical protein D3C77_356540 [compost metagenome]
MIVVIILRLRFSGKQLRGELAFKGLMVNGLSKSIHSLSKEPLNLRPLHRRFTINVKNV